MQAMSDLGSFERLRQRPADDPLRAGDIVRLLDFAVRVNDGPNYYILYKDIFCHRIYHFESARSDPVILDCGSNIGLSILYFKHVYPDARITAFEPDPTIIPYLKENIDRNAIEDVELVQAALSPREGSQVLCSDGLYGSALAKHAQLETEGVTPIGDVRCVRLRDYLEREVDFLKMNIEGAEADVLADSEDRLRQANCMAIEYHHLPGLPRTLHKILALLDRQGFDYLVHNFDAETNPKCQPPFRLRPDTRYYLLIYAQRRD